jgi:hypothetical protein
MDELDFYLTLQLDSSENSANPDPSRYTCNTASGRGTI